MVKEFYADKGVKRDRSSIYHSVSKVDIYYLNYKEFRMFYDSYFDDKKEDYLDEKDVKIEAEVLKNTSTRLSKEDYIELQNYRTRDITQKDLLDKLIESLPEDKRSDIYDMVNLRVKSWDWKSKNEYEIIESTEGLSGRAY
jgi:predicted RNase H-like nuclease